MLSLSPQYPPVELPITPSEPGPSATRYACRTACGTSSAKYASVCGPPGMSSHSVSRGSTGEGCIITSTVGGVLPSLIN